MSFTNLYDKVIITMAAGAMIWLGFVADHMYKENKKEFIAYQRKVNGDELTDLVILDEKNNRTILFGQTDGTYKNLQEILHKKQEENKKEYETLLKSYN